MVNTAPVNMGVPPAGVVYQLKINSVPEAVRVVVSPKLTVVVVGETLGAIGEGKIVMVSKPDTVTPLLVTETTPVVPAPTIAVI